MEIDKIIEGLNRKKNTSSIGSSNFQDTNLSEVEKTFIKTYSPEKSFIVYGTLAPNAPNHSVVEHIKGNWQQGIVRGRLEKKGWGADLGYYGFKHTSNEKQEEIKVFVLFSDELVANWQLLDDFEGNGYRRILAKYELENGQIGVGTIYAINEEEI
jgi:gamma-glutamylcyclotransferase (GGCT)/AIG2-like uncharacterized protein YtfP